MTDKNKISMMGYIILAVITFILAAIFSYVIFFGYPTNHPMAIFVDGVIGIIFSILFYFSFAFTKYAGISKAGTILFFVIGVGFLYIGVLLGNASGGSKFLYVIIISIVLLVFLIAGAWALRSRDESEQRIKNRQRL